VRIQGLSRAFGRGPRRVEALRGVDLSLSSGECLGLLGHNGSGKSTTLKVVLGLLRPDAGTVEVFGGEPGRRAARARTGYVPEEARRMGRLTGRETVDLFARLQGLRGRRARRARVEEALSDVGLEAGAWDQAMEGYSRGMARRLALAAAWVHRPPLLVLDEPTSGLDPLGTEEVLRVLDRHRQAGGATLLSTHDRTTAVVACNRALCLVRGTVALDGRLEDLLSGDSSPSLLGLLERARHA
jgi:ABC-type multidrug transport system ATPase subunit